MTVHPHACGEYLRFVVSSSYTAGSSPRVWGIPSDDTFDLFCIRFIPTRVGNTCRCYP
ncbi:hypothetical protein DESPIG_00032 [Desulfovibrio piger ATCC 29098]|nr:hypothetical protein DESPIG_00032 [Desulfovibrio piger ATCC 29098]